MPYWDGMIAKSLIGLVTPVLCSDGHSYNNEDLGRDISRLTGKASLRIEPTTYCAI